MPEGPEILYLSKICNKYLLNHKLVAIKSNSKHRLNLPKESKLLEIKTKGKLMILLFEDFYFTIHLGLTGWIVFEDAKYPRYELIFDNITVYIDDSRRFSKLKIIKNIKDYEKIINKLGVDIMTKEFTLEYFKETINKVNKKIADFLLQQNLFCGVGNYIKSETLYVARVNPYKYTRELKDDEIKNLYNAIRYVAFSNYIEMMEINKLKVDKRFKTIKTSVPYKFKVYGNEKDLSGNKITIEDIGGRTTYYVKSLQKYK